MAGYEKQTWVDDETVGTADRFNHMEEGIVLASKTGGVQAGAVIGWNGSEVPEGYEENSTMLSAIANAFFPIGYTFIDTTGSIDYSNHLGFVWEKTLQGVTPVGQNTSDTDFATIGKKGGAKSISYTPKGTIGGTAITREQLPAINLKVKYQNYPIVTNSDTTGTWTKNERAIGINVNDTTSKSELSTEQMGGGNTHTHGWTGTAQNISTMQPYQVVTFWTRVG